MTILPAAPARSIPRFRNEGLCIEPRDRPGCLSTFAVIAFIFEAVGFVDGALAQAMTHMGINQNAQTALLLGVSVLLVIFAIRRLGILFGALIIVLLVLLLLHQAVPGMTVPQFHVPSQPAGTTGV